MTITIVKYVCLIIGCYLLGNIYFAKIIGRIKKIDITKQGSGNPGTMNMLRNQGFLLGLITLLLDMGKGALGAMAGFLLFGGNWNSAQSIIGLYVGGLSVLVGNIYPVFYKFKGGKGAAVTYGMFFFADWKLGLAVFVIGFIYLLVLDYAVLTSFFMNTAFTIVEGFRYMKFNNIYISILLFAIFFLMWFAHRSNIDRLLLGKENKVNFKASLVKFKNKIVAKHNKKKYNPKEIG